MSLRTFFKSRTGKIVLGATAAFNLLSFISSTEQFSEIAKIARQDGGLKWNKGTAEGILLAGLSTPTLTGLNPMLREGRITGIFEKGATPNDWIDNAVITTTEPLLGYDKAQLVGLSVLAIDNVISFPGSLLGAGVGLGSDGIFHHDAALAKSPSSTLLNLK